ncbi:MAG TPA: hypothetical protein VFN18_11040 [Solirubrobacterales bacterium]|nr:hypothetical protein [Solirubrobacterales bacterium]
MRVIICCVGASALGCVALVGTAGAETAWGPPVTLSSPAETAYNPDLAVNENGRAEAVWETYSYPNIRGASKEPHGGWDPEVTISAGEADEFTPSVGIDAHGDSIAVWGAFEGLTFRAIETADGLVQGGWGSSAGLFSSEEGGIGQPRLAVNDGGDAVAVWAHAENHGLGQTVVIESARRPAGGSWSPAVAIASSEPELGYLGVVLDAGGQATAIWEGSEGVETASWPAVGGWTSPVVLSTGSGTQPQVAVNSAGEAVAIWRDFVGNSFVIDTASKPAAGGWTTAARLSTSGGYESQPHVAVDSAGNAVAVWGAPISLREVEVQSATRPAGGEWGDSVGVSSSRCEDELEPRVAMEGDGTAVAIWDCFQRSTLGVIESARAPLGGGWSLPEQISDHNLFRQLELRADSDGAVAVWHAYFEKIEGATLASVHRLSVTVGGGGSGVVESSPAGISCGDECEEGLVEGTLIKLRGVPASNSEPVVWVHCPGTVNSSNECEVTMGPTDEQAQATFKQNPPAPPSPSARVAPPPSNAPSPPTLLYSPNHSHSPNRKGGPRYTFAFADADPNVSFLCSIDRGKFRACVSPVVYRGLKPGKHNFRVKAVDPSGKQSKALSVGFRVGHSSR